MSKILIIEDTAGIAELERDYFEANGYEVELKADGKAGLEAALTNDYSLIICDIMLPSMDGFQIVREIRTVKE
ncbi:MAG: response regulator, partial [Veillonella sp.]|nr:response regulator [Veillonella sp.]